MIITKHSATVEVMNARTNNVKIAKETVAIFKQGHYTSPSGQVVNITDARNNAIDNTVYYPDPLPQIWGVDAI